MKHWRHLVSGLLFAALLAAPGPVVGAPGTGKPTVPTATPTVGISSVSGASADAATAGIRSPGGAEKGKAAEPAQYTTDRDTDHLQEAIDAYNRRYCPPATPMREVTQRNLRLLIELQLLTNDLTRFEKLIIRDGKVFKKVVPTTGPANPRQPTEKGEIPDSLMGGFGAAAEGLSDQSPKGQGNQPSPMKAKLVEKRVTFRSPTGELVEGKVYVPYVPAEPKKVITGKKFTITNDKLRKTLLPAKYGTTTTSAVKTGATPTTTSAPAK